MPKDDLYKLFLSETAQLKDEKSKQLVAECLFYLARYKQVDFIKEEVWKVIEDFPDYSVSNLGRVKHNLTNTVREVNTNSKKQYVYPVVSLRNRDTGVHKTIPLHIVVAKAFIEYYVEAKQLGIQLVVDHKDGNVKNARADNLQWVTSGLNNLRGWKRKKEIEKLRSIIKG